MNLLRVLLVCLLIVSGSLWAADAADPGLSVAQCSAVVIDATDTGVTGDAVGEVDEFARIALPEFPSLPMPRAQRFAHGPTGPAEVFLPVPPEPPAFA